MSRFYIHSRSVIYTEGEPFKDFNSACQSARLIGRAIVLDEVFNGADAANLELIITDERGEQRAKVMIGAGVASESVETLHQR